MSNKKIPFNQCLSPEEKQIESLQAKVKELDAQFRSQGTFYELLLADEQSKVKELMDALDTVKLKAISLADAQVIALEALATVKDMK